MLTVKEQKIKLVDFSSGDVHFSGHQHRIEYEMVICLEGAVGLQIDKSISYILQPFDCVFLPPEHFHWMWPEKLPGRYFNYLFTGSLPFLNTLANGRPFSLDSQRQYVEQLTELIGEIPNSTIQTWSAEVLFRRDSPGKEVPKGGKSESPKEQYFLWTMGLLEKIQRLQLNSSSSQGTFHGGFEQYIRHKIIDLIADDPGNKLSAQELAEHLGFDRTYLSRKLKLFTGRSLTAIYQEELMNQAMILLRRGASVKETAYKFGYANPYHFSRKFKEITGDSPSRIDRKV